MDTVRGGLKKTVLYQIWLERIFQGGFVRNRPWMGSKTEHTEKGKNNSREERRFNYSSKSRKVCKRWEKPACLGAAVYGRAALRQAYGAHSATVVIQRTAERMAVWNSETQAMGAEVRPQVTFKKASRR